MLTGEHWVTTGTEIVKSGICNVI